MGVLYAAAGGALGAAGRYMIGVAALRLMGPSFPWGTVTVNILGSFLMGVIVVVMALKYSMSQEVRIFLTTGILGGFTTFSAFSLDFITLMERKAHMSAALYLGSSVFLSILALFAGMSAVRFFLHWVA